MGRDEVLFMRKIKNRIFLMKIDLKFNQILLSHILYPKAPRLSAFKIGFISKAFPVLNTLHLLILGSHRATSMY